MFGRDAQKKSFISFGGGTSLGDLSSLREKASSSKDTTSQLAEEEDLPRIPEAIDNKEEGDKNEPEDNQSNRLHQQHNLEALKLFKEAKDDIITSHQVLT